MNTETKKENKVLKFVKDYVYYFILAFLIITMGVIMLVASIVSNKNPEVSVPTSLTFTMPVLNGTIMKGYDDANLQYNNVLNQWEIHKGIDFAVKADSQVFASLSGVVTNIYTNSLEGTVIEIDHGNDLKTVYGSLNQNVNVEIGDTIQTGDVIGTSSNSGINETNESHLHYEVWKNGSKVDPAGYLNIESK